MSIAVFLIFLVFRCVLLLNQSGWLYQNNFLLDFLLGGGDHLCYNIIILVKHNGRGEIWKINVTVRHIHHIFAIFILCENVKRNIIQNGYAK